MSPEAQRIAIAEACGFKIQSSALQVPDYLNDLNAMHSAEKNVLLNDIELRNKYATLLKSSVNSSRCDYFAIHATAAQRAEAFLRTKGLWTD